MKPFATDQEYQDYLRDQQDALRFRALAGGCVNTSAFLVQVRPEKGSCYGTAYFKEPPTPLPGMELHRGDKLAALRAAVDQMTARLAVEAEESKEQGA